MSDGQANTNSAEVSNTLRNGAVDARETVQPTLTEAERRAAEYPATWQDECADVENAFARSGVRPTWPDDEPGNIGPMADAMAEEIARLRITDAEREAIDRGSQCLSQNDVLEGMAEDAATLRGLLERLA